MTARNIKTGDIYEGGKTYVGSIIGVDRRTLLRWEKRTDTEVYNNFEVRFKDVIRKGK